METRLHIFRHGQTVWNVEKRVQGYKESPLTALGREQAADARRKLAGLTLDAVYSSTQGRAIDTARILTADLGLPHHQDEGLKEINLGVWEGLRRPELEAQHAEDYARYWKTPSLHQVEGGETLQNLIERSISSFKRIAKAHQGKSVVIVTHGMLIRTAMNAIRQQPVDAIWSLPNVDNLSHSIVLADAQGNLSIEQFCDQPFPFSEN